MRCAGDIDASFKKSEAKDKKQCRSVKLPAQKFYLCFGSMARVDHPASLVPGEESRSASSVNNDGLLIALLLSLGGIRRRKNLTTHIEVTAELFGLTAIK